MALTIRVSTDPHMALRNDTVWVPEADAEAWQRASDAQVDAAYAAYVKGRKQAVIEAEAAAERDRAEHEHLVKMGLRTGDFVNNHRLPEIMDSGRWAALNHKIRTLVPVEIAPGILESWGGEVPTDPSLPPLGVYVLALADTLLPEFGWFFNTEHALLALGSTGTKARADYAAFAASYERDQAEYQEVWQHKLAEHKSLVAAGLREGPMKGSAPFRSRAPNFVTWATAGPYGYCAVHVLRYRKP